MLKTHHKMIGWNREFQYLPAKIIAKIAKIIAKINTSQLKPYTFHSLTSLCPPCLTFLSLLSSPGSDSTLNHSLSLLDSPYLNLFSCISPEGWARSWLFLRASVCASVRPPPRGSSKPMLLHHTVWNFRKSPMYFTVLSSRRPQNTP